MATKPSKNLKKLSSAILKGYQMAKENNIKIARGEFLRVRKRDSKIYCACALGMAAIGVFGLEEAKTKDEEKVIKFFKLTNKGNSCLPKKFSNNIPEWYDIENTVTVANDHYDRKPDEIAEALEACNL